MENYYGAASALPGYVALPAVALFGALLFLVASQPGSRAASYLVSAIWLRYVMSALPHISFIKVGGLTLNAIASILVIGGSLLVIRRRNLREPAMIPLALIILIVLVSGVLNGHVVDSLESALRFTYFGVIALLFVDAAEDLGFSPLINRVLTIFAVPVGFQIISWALGLAKETELDGSASYIGGYNHESAFSIVLVTGMVLVALHRRMGGISKLLLLAVFVTGVLMANYRTSIVSMAPLLLVVAFVGLRDRVIPSQRTLAGIVAAGLVLVVAASVPSMFGDRFNTLYDAIDRGTDLIKPPNDFTRADQQVMSARPLIWSRYYYGWLDGTTREHVFGKGPSSWEGEIDVYAHNTLLSTLYELGLAGLAAMLLLWAWMVALCFKIAAAIRIRLIAAHISFIVLNQSTMPFWQVEGAILYGVICGATIFFAHRSRRVTPATDPVEVQAEGLGRPPRLSLRA